MDPKMDLKNADTVLWRHLSLPKLHWSENGAQIRWSGYVFPHRWFSGNSGGFIGAGKPLHVGS